ncbi:mediator complex subunit 3 fungal domain-containing protein [Purpureocillium lavendulum]|uniref:Mediator complex subunit 3 fungal domain-containing protein n=1 Tax=Purpureocillium lavendulum TaxID=1247861 RepID=A0AB34FHC5_9HYPO|nr:mediator complex subunit 3 fungal domain-containing protein [Purpureocillium lavendulum]
MSGPKTYFLCPTSDFIHPPPTGPICLGSIIQFTSRPQYPLNRGEAVAVADVPPPVVETDWKKTVSAEKEHELGVYAQFLLMATGGLPLGAGVNVTRSTTTTSAFAFDTVTTISFEPAQGYVEEAIKARAVQTWLREPKQRFSPVVSLFLVTGIKLVKGARMQYLTSQSTAGSANLGLDLSALGALATTVGPKGHWVSRKDDETESNRAEEFVFAFRVKRLRFGRKLKLKEYTKGAFLAVGGEEEESDECVLVEDVDGSNIETAKVVPDVTENGLIYCVPA